MLAAAFIDSVAGRIFCTRWQPDESKSPGTHRNLLLLPPFGEEMNKSRHLLAAIGRAAASAGFHVMLPDLYGTGDSEGDFGDATLADWRADIDAAVEFLGAEGPLYLFGLRFGALLACDAARRHSVTGLCLTQPVLEGRTQLSQMLRLRLASGLTGSGERERSSDLRARLAAGESLEIAGYRLNGTLAAELERLDLQSLCPTPGTSVGWIEVASETARESAPAVLQAIGRWHQAGVSVVHRRVICDAFWSTQELAPCSELDAHVVRALEG